MKPIGGEIPPKNDGLYSYITDSGRSSLRLILHSLKDKKFALPDYLCGVILDVFKEMGIEYKFYHIREDLTCGSDITPDIDVFYYINYFGKKQNIKFKDRQDDRLIYLEDSVFLPTLVRPMNAKNWIGFNSLRKISPATGGSIIKSTIKLDDKNYPMLQYNLLHIFDFYRRLDAERNIRLGNYMFLAENLQWAWLPLTPDFPTFFPMLVDKRDELREYLKTKEIYLPVHWPKPEGVENPIYDRIISIPVDSRYDKEDMERVAEEINGFYGK